MSRLTISRAALDLIESFEGFRARSAQLAHGGYTIGFGHSATARSGMQITREQAEELLRWDLRPIEDLVRQSCHAPLTQNQFDALVSFAFNIGAENFSQSDVLRHINQGEPVAAAVAMNAWRRANLNGKIIIVDALVRRRAAEINLFFETAGARPAAPTSVIIPKLDYSAALLAPNPDSIKEIVPNKADGEFAIKPREEINSDIAKVSHSGAQEVEVQIETPKPEAVESVETAPKQEDAHKGIPREQVDAILDAKLGEGVLPFPETTLEEKAKSHENPAANAVEEAKVAPANDIDAKSSAAGQARTKPHDVFRSQGIELAPPPAEPINWLGLMPWFVALLGAIAALYGFHQMGSLEVLSALGIGNTQNAPATIGPNGFRAILITICGFAAVLLSLLSLIDRFNKEPNS